MKTYIYFLCLTFLKSFLNIFLIMLSLVFILNILKEIEFFNNTDVSVLYPIYLSLMNTPSLIFEMFPFIFLISTQFFFIKLLNNNEINIFKYSGLNNLRIISILGILSFFIGILIITLFYNLSSNLQKYYLEIKNQYSTDKSYLAVINKNGLWIKDIVNKNINIINSGGIQNNFLTDTFITTFNENYEPIRNIKSNKINITSNTWLIYDASVFEDNEKKNINLFEFQSNFNLKRIKSLFSNLSSLSIIELFSLRNNYKSLNYSTTEVDIQIQKIISYPLYFVLMTILASVIMFNTKKFKNVTLKLAIGLFISVVIYYMNNFFLIMGNTEKIPIYISIWVPLITLLLLNSIAILKINEK